MLQLLLFFGMQGYRFRIENLTRHIDNGAGISYNYEYNEHDQVTEYINIQQKIGGILRMTV